MLKVSKSSACDQSMVVTHISQSVSFSLKALVKSNHPLPCEPSNPYPFLGLLSPPLPSPPLSVYIKGLVAGA